MSVKIELDQNPRGLFYVAGDTISGKVILEFFSPIVLKSATIYCYAEESVDKSSNLHGRFPNHTYFNLSQKLLESQQEFPAGITCFSFSFTLPLNSEVARLGPLPLSLSSSKTFKIENCIKFYAQTDSPSSSSSNLECIIPFSIRSLWSPSIHLEDKNMMPFEQDIEILNSCACFFKSSNAKVILEGCPAIACWGGKVSLSLKIKIKSSSCNRPKNVLLIFAEMTTLQRASNDVLDSKVHFSKPCIWNPRTNPKINGYWTMDVEAQFEVPENDELITANGFSWNREFYWNLILDFGTKDLILVKSNPKLGISFPQGTLNSDQQALSSLIYYLPNENAEITQ